MQGFGVGGSCASGPLGSRGRPGDLKLEFDAGHATRLLHSTGAAPARALARALLRRVEGPGSAGAARSPVTSRRAARRQGGLPAGGGRGFARGPPPRGQASISPRRLAEGHDHAFARLPAENGVPTASSHHHRILPPLAARINGDRVAARVRPSATTPYLSSRSIPAAFQAGSPTHEWSPTLGPRGPADRRAGARPARWSRVPSTLRRRSAEGPPRWRILNEPGLRSACWRWRRCRRWRSASVVCRHLELDAFQFGLRAVSTQPSAVRSRREGRQSVEGARRARRCRTRF